MKEQEKPLIDRMWEFTKDISVKVSRKAEKHWKINTLRVEIASIKHRINVKYKDLGRFVFESLKSGTLEEESYKNSLREFFDELTKYEGEIMDRENRIEVLEREISLDGDQQEAAGPDTESKKAEVPEEIPPPPPETSVSEAKAKSAPAKAKVAQKKKTTRKPRAKAATGKTAKTTKTTKSKPKKTTKDKPKSEK